MKNKVKYQKIIHAHCRFNTDIEDKLLPSITAMYSLGANRFGMTARNSGSKSTTVRCTIERSGWHDQKNHQNRGAFIISWYFGGVPFER